MSWQDDGMKKLRATIIGFALATANIVACGDYLSSNGPQALAIATTGPDPARADRAIERLRKLGRGGLDALLAVHAGALANPAPLDPKLRRAIDIVSGQRDGHASRLFWHTNLEDAKAEAAKLGRPILSLRLLGRLDEEFSCANSRYFRTALYPNREISEILSDDFVLHWESVRPVPRVTIDYGDGRKLERTITGNSAHYVLTADGQPLEALPGLFGPKAFVHELQKAAQLNRQYVAANATERPALLRSYHAERLASLISDWSSDLRRAGGAIPSSQPLTYAVLTAQTSPEHWKAMARLHQDEARLDDASRTLMRAKNPRAADAGRIAVSKAVVEDPMLRAMGEFERSMAEDTVRNRYALHAPIHAWFAEASSDTTMVQRLNNKVYAELFLMPSWDPWLGLRPANGYSGLEGDGASLASAATAAW
jgi:hypothetical protein